MDIREPRVLGLSCSPRRGGNTDIMMDAALEGAGSLGAHTEKVYVASLDVNPCRACNACFETGSCVQQDDMQELYPRLLSWEGIILAAPIFSMNLAAQAKILIDRLQCCWAKKYVLKEHTVPDDIRAGRKGLWLSAAGFKHHRVFDPARVTVDYFFAMLEIEESKELAFNNVDDKGAIREVRGALESCRKAGEWIVS